MSKKIEYFNFAKPGKYDVHVLKDKRGRLSYQYYCHWLGTRKFNDRRYRPLYHKISEKDTCKVCEIDTAIKRYDLLIMENDLIVKILHCGCALLRNISECMGHFQTNDLQIVAEGEGLRRQYAVFPSRHVVVQDSDDFIDVDLELMRFPEENPEKFIGQRSLNKYHFITART